MADESKHEGQDDQRHDTEERKPVLIDIGGEVFVSHSRDPVARWLINDIRIHQLNGPKKIRIHEMSNGTIVVFPPEFRLSERFRRRFCPEQFGWSSFGGRLSDATRHKSPPPSSE